MINRCVATAIEPENRKMSGTGKDPAFPKSGAFGSTGTSKETGYCPSIH